MSRKTAYITLKFWMFNILLTQTTERRGRRGEISKHFSSKEQLCEKRKDNYSAIAAVK